MKISKAGLDLIKTFEGLELTAYKCPAGVWTIGWGHTGDDVTPDKTITEEKAEQLLLGDLKRFEDAVNIHITVPLNQPQFDALVSFTHNCGIGALKESTLRKRLNKGEDPNKVAQEELPKWVKAGDKTLPGLVARRKKEVELFISGKEIKPKQKITITSSRSTALKKEPVDSTKLERDQKVIIKGNRTYRDVEVLQKKNGHTQINLPWGAGVWWVFDQHWSGLGGPHPQPVKTPAVFYDGVMLDVPYQSQRDNYRDASRTCFSSSCAMAAMYMRPGCIKNDNEYIQKVFAIGDTTNPNVHVKVLNSLGIKAKFRQDGTLLFLKKRLDANIPVPIGILHKGPGGNPSGFGHWICAIGYHTDPAKYTVHDPWGKLDNYTGTYESTNGNAVVYTEYFMEKRWTVEGSGSGWWLDLQ